MKPLRVRKRPIVVNAWVIRNVEDLEALTNSDSDVRLRVEDGVPQVFDYLHDTWINFKYGDAIMEGTRGENYPCEESVFVETYEEATEEV